MAVAVWARYSLEEGQRAQWQLGPLMVWAERRATDWRISYWWSGSLIESDVAVELPTEAVPPADARVVRVASESSPASIALVPALGDRPFVISPDTSFLLLPDQKVSLYVTTPLWVRVLLGTSPVAILDVPTHRPSDTWFGPVNREGELCYGARTRGRLSLENLERLAMRAITQVDLDNRASDALSLERVRLPIPHLSLYREPGGLFWTERATLLRVTRTDEAAIRLDKAPPQAAASAAFVAGPRQESTSNALVRAFQLLGMEL